MITFSTSQIQNVDLSHGSSIRHDDARANPRLRSQLVHRSSLLKADTYAPRPVHARQRRRPTHSWVSAAISQFVCRAQIPIAPAARPPATSRGFVH